MNAAARSGDHGVPFLQLPTKVFHSRVAQYVDPDGLTISVGQADRAADRREFFDVGRCYTENCQFARGARRA